MLGTLNPKPGRSPAVIVLYIRKALGGAHTLEKFSDALLSPKSFFVDTVLTLGCFQGSSRMLGFSVRSI